MQLRISYANVASTLALVLALGGTGAYAAGLAKNSVASKQIKNGSVQAKDLKKATITGAQVADGSLTGADIAAGTVGKVPSAATVDTVVHVHKVLPPVAIGAPVNLYTRGPLSLGVQCSIGGFVHTALTLTSSTNDAAYDADGFTSLHDQDLDAATPSLVAAAQDSGGLQYLGFRLSSRAADGTTLIAVGSVEARPSGCTADFVVLG